MSPYPAPLVYWRGVLVRASLAARLEAACPPPLRPTGRRSGLRTRADMTALYGTAGATRSSWHLAGLACDLSPSADLSAARLTGQGLSRPVAGEPWHVQIAGNVEPWARAVTAGRIALTAEAVRCAVAEVGPEHYESCYPTAAPGEWACVLTQGYATRLGGADGQPRLVIDGVIGPRTVGAVGRYLGDAATTRPATEWVARLADLAAVKGV